MPATDRSVVHPSATWSECMELMERLDSLGRKPVATAVLAEAFGLKNPKTRSLQAKITSSRLFGLITVKNGVIAIADAGRDILHPTTTDLRPLERECFVRPKLYRDLLETFDGKSLPREDLFENILAREYGLSDISKKRAAKCFRDSAEELGFLVNGVIYNEPVKDEMGLPDDNSLLNDCDTPCERHETLQVEETPSVPSRPSPTSGADAASSYSITAPALNGGFIEIRVPKDAEAADFELAKQLLDVFKNRAETERGDSVG